MAKLTEAVGRQKEKAIKEGAKLAGDHASPEQIALKTAEYAKSQGWLFEPTADQVAEKLAAYAEKGSAPARQPGPKPKTVTNGAGIADAMEAVKALVEQYGGDQVKRCVDLFDKG